MPSSLCLGSAAVAPQRGELPFFSDLLGNLRRSVAGLVGSAMDQDSRRSSTDVPLAVPVPSAHDGAAICRGTRPVHTSRVPTQATRATSVQELDRDLPRVVLQARTLVQAGDTVAALGLLRRAYADDDDDPHLVFALGTLLARTAPLEETDFEQRLAAEDLLERALRMLPNDAAVLVELAFLKRRQFMRVDARRLLESVVEPGPSAGLDPRIAADAHFVLARILTEEMDDFEHLVFMPSGWREDGATGSDALDPSARCPAGVQYFCYNYSRPRDFNSQFLRASSSTDRGEDYPARIEVEYRAALSYVPDHLQAARGLLGLLYRQGRFAEVSSEASSLAELSPDDPYPHVFGGLARYEAQDWEGAKKLFDVGLSLMSARERAPYDDVSYLLRSRDASTYEALEPDRAREYERILWSKSDPLFLIPENERRLEHVARVTYAELAFGDPERRLPGWSSDRGQVFIRYGEPERIWMLRQDQQASSVTGRWIFWNYRIDAPSYIFRRQLGYTRVNFDLSANTEAYVRELAEVEDVHTVPDPGRQSLARPAGAGRALSRQQSGFGGGPRFRQRRPGLVPALRWGFRCDGHVRVQRDPRGLCELVADGRQWTIRESPLHLRVASRHLRLLHRGPGRRVQSSGAPARDPRHRTCSPRRPNRLRSPPRGCRVAPGEPTGRLA